VTIFIIILVDINRIMYSQNELYNVNLPVIQLFNYLSISYFFLITVFTLSLVNPTPSAVYFEPSFAMA
jgi:hypothetical protein